MNPALIKIVSIIIGLGAATLLLWLNFQAFKPQHTKTTASIEQRLENARIWQYHPSGTLEYHLTTRLIEREAKGNNQRFDQPFAALYDIQQPDTPPFTIRAQSGFFAGKSRDLTLTVQVRGERATYDDEPRWVLSTDELTIRETDYGMLAESEQHTILSAINAQQHLLSISESAGFRLYPETGQMEQVGGVNERIIPAAIQKGATDAQP